MHYQTTRKFARYGHILIAMVQLAYIYTPLHNLKYSMLAVQIVTTPLLILSGIWITKGSKIWMLKDRIKNNNTSIIKNPYKKNRIAE